MIKLFKRLKESYPKSRVQEDKNYVSFSLGGAFVYELRIQQDVIRLLASNYPAKASFGECFKIIKQYKIEGKSINGNKIIYEGGVRSADKFTLRIEIPYKKSNLTNDDFISSVINSCDKFHNVLLPLISSFQKDAVGSLSELMSDSKVEKNTKSTSSNKSIQSQIADSVCKKYKDAVVKKVDKDNYLDIHLPSVNEKKGTHLGVNTAKDVIRMVFYCRDAEFVQDVLSKSSELEEYSQGIRPAGDPSYTDVKSAVKAIFKFIEELQGSKSAENEEEMDDKLVEAYRNENKQNDKQDNQLNSQIIEVGLQELIDRNILFNLYNPNISSDNWGYDSDSFQEWDSMHKNTKIDYRNNFYGLVFPSISTNIESDLKFGFINSKGEKLSEYEFDAVSKIVNGVSAVKKSNQWYILKLKENKLKEVKYENVSVFSEGLAVVMNEEGKYGYINEDGKEIIKCKYDHADLFSEGLAKIGKGDILNSVYGFINKKGEEVIPLKYDFTIESVKEGLICISSDTNNKYGYLDKKGNIKIPFKFDFASNFKEALARIKQKEKWGYIDYNGKISIPCSFDECSDFSNGLALVKKDYDSYFINSQGEKIISCDDYKDIYSFSDNLAAVSIADEYGQNVKWGFIDKKGKLVIKCNFDEVSDFTNGFASVRKDDNWAIIDSSGNFLYDYTYKSISEFNDNVFIVGITAESSGLDVREKLLSFFNRVFGNKDWESSVYPAYNHRPTLGLYNAGSKELLAMGLGRKDRIFTVGINFRKNKESILNSLNEAQLTSFTEYDYANLIKQIMKRFEEIGSLHEDSCDTDDEEQMDGLISEMNDEIEILRELIPSIPDINELSPGDF